MNETKIPSHPSPDPADVGRNEDAPSQGNGTKGGNLDLFPLNILRESIKAVPETKFALAVTGVIASVAIILLLKIDLALAAIGFVVMLIFMTAIVLFVTAVRKADVNAVLPGRLLIWYSFLLVLAICSSAFSSAVTNRPWRFRDYIASALFPSVQPGTIYTHDFVFGPTDLDVFCCQDDGLFHLGLTKLLTDKDVANKRLMITSAKVSVDGTNLGRYAGSDVWVYLGDSPFSFGDDGGGLNVQSPFTLVDNNGNPQSAMRVVIGDLPLTTRAVGDRINLWSSYDFRTREARGSPDFHLKSGYSSLLKPREALYAQIALWVADPNVRLHVTNVKLHLEGYVLKSDWVTN